MLSRNLANEWMGAADVLSIAYLYFYAVSGMFLKTGVMNRRFSRDRRRYGRHADTVVPMLLTSCSQ